MAGRYGNFQNPYYVDPSLDITQGLQGLSQGLQHMGVRKAKEEKEAKLATSKAAAIKAFQTGDKDIIAEAILSGDPEIGNTLGELYDKSRGYAKEDYVTNLEKMLTEVETTGTLAPAVPTVPTLASPTPTAALPGLGGTPAPITAPGKEASKKEDVIRSIINKDPKKGKQMLEYEFAKNDPKKYKAWRDVYRPDEKGANPSQLKKHITEREELIKSGVDKDDPRVKAYDAKINPDKSISKSPSITTKMMNERDALIDQLSETMSPEEANKHPDVVALNNKIMGDMSKKYGPSPLKKLIKERQEYLDEGYAEDSDIIQAYDMKISGLDINVEKMTDDEIDMWGAWLNLTGKMPSVGRGKAATAVRVAILKSGARQALGNKEFSKDPKVNPQQAALNVVAKSADTKSIQGALNYLEKQTSSMGSFIQNMDAQIERVGGLMKDLPLVDTRLLNIPIRFLHKKIAGNPELAKYELYLAEIEREISKLSNAATSSIAAMSVEEIKVWERIHDKNLSTKDMWELLKETRHAAQLRMKSVDDQLGRTREKMRTRDYSGSEVEPEVSSQEEYDALPSGAVYLNKGKRMRKP